MGSGSVIHDRVGVTCIGHPPAANPSLDSGPSPPIDLSDLPASPQWRSHRWAPPKHLKKVEAKAQGAGTKTLITLVIEDAIVAGA